MGQGLARDNPFINLNHRRLLRYCLQCKETRVFHYSDSLCDVCDIDRRTRKKITKVATGFRPATPYNAQLWNLYLTYIKRCKLKPAHHRTTLKLAEYLEKNAIPTLRSWRQVVLESREFKAAFGTEPLVGCPVKKIGRRLQAIQNAAIY